MFLSCPDSKHPIHALPLQAVLDRIGDHLTAHQEYFIPSVPMEMPSLTVIVPNIWGMLPASHAPQPVWTGRSDRRCKG